MDSAKLGWLAGMLDGEGTIGLTKSHKIRQPQIYVSVGNCHLGALQCFLDEFGIGTIRKGRVPTSPRHRQGYSWTVRCRQAIQVLEQVAPFLIIKRPQAEVALEYGRNIGAQGRKLSDDERKTRSVLFNLLSSMNKRGPRPEDRKDN